MGKFIEGQKVICVDRGEFDSIENNKIYRVNRCTEEYVYFVGGEDDGFYPKRFKTIIESIDDVLPGMELTVVDAIDENNIEKIKEYGFKSYLGWTNFLGNKIIVEKVEEWSLSADKSIIYLKNTGLVWPIEMFKEYPGNVGIDNLKKEKKEMEYKITQRYGNGITLSDIYDKKPKSCSEWDAEFSRLLDTQRPYLDEKFINSIDCYKVWKNWLLEKGFIEKANPKFEPFNLTFRIENEDMLRELWHRFNNNLTSIWNHSSKYTVGIHKKSSLTVNIWEQLDNACIKLGLKG